MSYKLDPNRMYMMPVHFGPMTGPRQNTDGGRFANTETPLTTSYSVSFLTDRGQLEELVPEGFEIIGEPVVKVFTSGTVVQVFLLADSVETDVWSNDRNGADK